jgi:hypothetical protein
VGGGGGEGVAEPPIQKFGDLFITFQVQFPDSLNKAQRDAVAKTFAKTTFLPVGDVKP